MTTGQGSKQTQPEITKMFSHISEGEYLLWVCVFTMCSRFSGGTLLARRIHTNGERLAVKLLGDHQEQLRLSSPYHCVFTLDSTDNKQLIAHKYGLVREMLS